MQHSMTTVRQAAYIETEVLCPEDTDLVCDLYLSVDQPCQLLGVGLCGAKQAFTAELALYEVQHNFACTHIGCAAILRHYSVSVDTN